MPLTPESLQDALIAGIATLPSVRSFGLTLCGFSLGPGRADPPPDRARARQLCAAEEHLRDLDLDALALRIRGRVPRLQVVALALIGHPARANVSAVIDGEEGEWEEGAVEMVPVWHAKRMVEIG